MRSAARRYLQEVKEILSYKPYLIFVSFLALIAYGYAACNTSVSIDDLEYDRYVGEGNVMLASGRFGMWLWAFLEGKWENSYLIDLLSVFMLVAAAINFCILFRRIAGERISMAALTVFSGMFISYPLMQEIWEYTGANLNVCGGFLLASWSLLAVYDQIHGASFRFPWRLIVSAVLMMVVCSSYESIAAVYVFFVFAVIALQVVYAQPREKKFLEILRQGLIYAAVLAVGFLLRLLVHQVILAALDLSAVSNGQTNILWGTMPAADVLKGLIFSCGRYYGLRSIVYFPLTMLVIAGVIYLVIGIPAVRRHGAVLLVPGIGMLFSLVALSVLQGYATPYRTCQVFGAFVAFVAMLFVGCFPQKKGRTRAFLRIGALTLCGFLCFYQASYINYLLEMNHRRSEEEAQIVRQISVDLQRDFDVSKPVIFVGSIEINPEIIEAVSIPEDSLRWKLYAKLYEKTYTLKGEPFYPGYISRKLPETNVNSVINWSSVAFGNQEAMQHLFSYYGYEYVMADFNSTYYAADAYVKEHGVPDYPSQGYIQDVGEYILVHL